MTITAIKIYSGSTLIGEASSGETADGTLTIKSVMWQNDGSKSLAQKHKTDGTLVRVVATEQLSATSNRPWSGGGNFKFTYVEDWDKKVQLKKSG
jgi:hypothetical protein